MIESYINKIASITKRGDAREESYYPALAELLEEFSQTERHKKVHVTVLPKKTEAGNPDFRVWDGKHSQVGCVEAKLPKVNLWIPACAGMTDQHHSQNGNLDKTEIWLIF
jgi:hypothetical protein